MRTGGRAEAPSGVLDEERLDALVDRVAVGPGRDTLTTRAPFSGRPLAQLPQGTAQDVADAVVGARAAQRDWAGLGVHYRAEVLLRLHDLLLDRQSEVLDLIQLETGKARLHAWEEVADVAIVARHYARVGPRLLADRRLRGLVPGLTQVRESRHAKGVVGIVSPWNYPLTLAVTDALPALLAGNAVVIKPDTRTALTALWSAGLLAEAGVPDGVFQVVLGAGDVVGQALVETADYVCFTGSTATGRRVAETAGRRLAGCSLELGGKNTMYVADDADLGAAAEGAVRACFSSAGQLCISMERIAVHQAVAGDFLDRFLHLVRGIRLGAGLDFGADMGCLIDERQLEKVEEHVADALAHHARLLAGGRRRPDVGALFYEPTVLGEVPPQARCHQEETFGPVIAVYPVADDDAAVDLANDTPYGLNAAVWTGDARRGRELARRIRTGTVNVNEGYWSAWASVAAPMGGRGISGLGRRHGTEGLTKYTDSQTIAAQRGPWLGAGYRHNAAVWTSTGTRLLRAMRAAGLS